MWAWKCQISAWTKPSLPLMPYILCVSEDGGEAFSCFSSPGLSAVSVRDPVLYRDDSFCVLQITMCVSLLCFYSEKTGTCKARESLKRVLFCTQRERLNCIWPGYSWWCWKAWAARYGVSQRRINSFCNGQTSLHCAKIQICPCFVLYCIILHSSEFKLLSKHAPNNLSCCKRYIKDARLENMAVFPLCFWCVFWLL